MSDARYNIVFYGIIQSDKDRAVVVENMARMFKTTPDKIKPYFSGGRKIIKGDVDDLTAEKYRVALENIGLRIKIEPAEAAAKPAATGAAHAKADSIETGDISLAEVGANVIENPVPVEPQPIADISNITVAEVGADVIENPVPVEPQPIADISDISLAEVGANVLDHPAKVEPMPIGDISNISLAEAGADLLKNPPEKKAAPIPDISALSLKN
jgi:hypothetical protein